MSPLTAGSVCPGCGFDNDQENDTSFLPLRTVLQDRYVLGHVQAWESDAAVYAAYDRTLQAPCVVREFLPKGIANRLEGNRDVHVRERFRKNFDGYKRSFTTLWQTMMQLRTLAAALPVYDVFPANETVYAVSQPVDGVLAGIFAAHPGGLHFLGAGAHYVYARAHHLGGTP